MNYKLTAIIEKEDTGYVSLCPEFDIASQGNTIEEARDNLIKKTPDSVSNLVPAHIKQKTE